MRRYQEILRRYKEIAPVAPAEVRLGIAGSDRRRQAQSLAARLLRRRDEGVWARASLLCGGPLDELRVNERPLGRQRPLLQPREI